MYPWLGLATGLVALGLGASLLTTRLRHGRRGLDSAHVHTHGTVSRPGLAALAVAGGILPSPSAIVVLTGAMSYDRIGYGLGLIAAFGLGLAASLTLMGLLALRAQSAVVTRMGRPWASLIPLGSALAITLFGGFFVLRGIAQVA